MDQEKDKEIKLRDKLVLFFKSNKKIIIFFIIIFILSVFSLVFFDVYKNKKNDLVAEKYIYAGNLLNLNEEEKAKELYIDILFSKNKFYSIIALNTILEKKLETNNKKILEYFDVLESMNISKEQRDILLFKKSLYLIKNSNLKEGKNILKKLIDSNSKLKSLAEEVLAN